MLLVECFFVLWKTGDWNGTQAVAPESVPVPCPMGVLVSLVEDYLFRRFHRFHKTKEKSTGFAVPAKIKPIKSGKHVLCLRVPWFHAGMLVQRVCKAGQR